MITIERLVKRFGPATAVDGVSLEIAAGDAVALWGANGAGKTTVIRCVLGLFRFGGRITVNGHDVLRDGKAARRLIGYVPQELGFYDELRVGEAIRLFARLRGIDRVPVGPVLEHVRIGGQERKRVRELSGGMKQRLALALALLGDPPILVLDEVTASLDAVGREEFVGMIAGLADGGRTLLFASHRADEVATLARRVVVLERGKAVACSAIGSFGTWLGTSSVLTLRVAAERRAEAAVLLREGGFEPRIEPSGLHVAVESARKAVPFRLLADARIAVDDFELVTAAGLAREAGRPDEAHP
jgi:ABC-type multidrug transport system ATPase subunit